jgi:hypothetical protein
MALPEFHHSQAMTNVQVLRFGMEVETLSADT